VNVSVASSSLHRRVGHEDSSWLHWFSQQDNARLRLFCFPYAGVGPAVFRLWPGGLPTSVDVCAVALPGRGSRINEPTIADISDIAEAAAWAISAHVDRPFAFFGHSMGALVAYETAHRLSRSAGCTPEYLFLSGRCPPHIVNDGSHLHTLPDQEFVLEINRRYGGIPPVILNEPELLALLLPALRADIAALELFEPVQRPPLDCPMSVFGGLEDERALRDHLEEWRNATTGKFSLRQFPGGHFYIEQRRSDLLADISQALFSRLDEPGYV